MKNMPYTVNAPTVSVILYAYEAQAFVAETLRSLFAQDYSSLEIFLSDDGSKDETFSIMQEAAKNYAGPHRVLLNRNSTNLGICSQINAGVRQTSGALIMLANADDLYTPDRISRLVEAWRTTHPRPTIIWTDLEQIDSQSRPLGKYMSFASVTQSLAERVRKRIGVPATGLMCDRRVFSEFGPLPETLSLEDPCIGLRAALLGPMLHLTEPTLFYRIHTKNVSQVYAAGEYDSWLGRRATVAVWQMSQGHRAFIEMLRDMHQHPAQGVILQDVKRARWAAIEKIVETAMLADYYGNDTTLSERGRWAMLMRLLKQQLKLTIKRLLPFIERRNERWEYRQYTKIGS